MYPIYNIDGIETIESEYEEKHVVILMLIQPSDSTADEYIKRFNYWHKLANRYCNIYLLGYSKSFGCQYDDVQCVDGIENESYEYSDTCFIEVCAQLRKRLKNWSYSGEPELIVLQNNPNSNSKSLDFSSYNYIDINYGLQKGYIDSIARFMERLLVASQKEVTANEAIGNANKKRIKPRNVLEYAIENTPKLPKSVRQVLKDQLFYKTTTTKNKHIMTV